MTPATTQALPFKSEGDAGNTDQNFCEMFAVQSLGRLRRLEDSEAAADKLGAIANSSRDDLVRSGVDPRIEHGAA